MIDVDDLDLRAVAADRAAHEGDLRSVRTETGAGVDHCSAGERARRLVVRTALQMTDSLAELAIDRAKRPVGGGAVGREANPGRDLEQEEIVDPDRTSGHGPQSTGIE